jgi:iron complex outermembrane recepter protein
LKIKIYLVFVALLIANTIIAQSKTCTVKIILQAANSKDTISNATVTFTTADNNALVITKVLDINTVFTLNQFTKYIIKITCIGFVDASKIITTTDTLNTILFVLKRNSTDLKTVVVKSKKPLIKQEDDKTIVDATVLANSSTNAFEVLEKTPGAVIDQDGNVYLSSTTPATIFINGREMKLSSADIASLLKSLPAGSVSKIEILRNPSAKYDAASSGGIVNIVLKKGVKLGSSGSVNLGHFQGTYSTQTVGFNLNKSIGKVSSYLSYQFTNKNNFDALSSERLVGRDSSKLFQKAYTTFPTTNHYFGAGIDYTFSKKINIGYDFRLTNTNGNSYAINAIDIYKNLQQTLAKNQSDINNKYASLFIGNNISGKYKIDSAGSEWTVELDYNYYNNKTQQFYNNSNLIPAKPSLTGDGNSKNDKNILVAQTDLVVKLPKKITVELGLKTTISNSNNGATYFLDSANTGRKIDLYQTNTFKYKEVVSAAYVQISKTFWGFTLKPGLRFESTNITGQQTIPKDTSLAIKRTDVFPYVFLRHNLFKIFKMQLVGNAVYRRSIKRPYYEILNPYPKYIDQYLFDVGNPSLQPQFTTNYEVNVMFADFPVMAFGINQTKDIFSNVTYQDDNTKIAFRTYDNVGKNKELYFRIVGGIPPGGKYFFYAGAQHNYNQYDGKYQNVPLNYNRGSWVFFMYHEYKASKTLTIDVQGFMRTKGLQNFYELENLGGLYISANKKILKNKGNLIFSVNDVFNTNQTAFKLNQGNIVANGNRQTDSRRVGITFRYSFGLSKPKENINFGATVDGKEN